MDKPKLETPIHLFPIDEYKKQHLLLKSEPREEGGPTKEYKTGYQKRLSVQKCLEMLFPESKIVSVSIELHEDYVVEFEDGSFEYCQVKHKDEGEDATFGTLAEALHNLFYYYKNDPKANNNFTIQTNREARSSQRGHGNLYELKYLLSRKEKYGLTPNEENRLKGLKLVVHNLQIFQSEDYELVDQFIDRLIIKTDEDDVKAVEKDCRLKAQELLRSIHKTPFVNLDLAEDFHDKVYLLVDQAGQEKEDRSKRIIYRPMVDKLIPRVMELAELVIPVSNEEEKYIYSDPDPHNTILERKCKDAGVEDIVDTLKEAKIIARNRNDQYKENPIAVRYISGLRKKIKSRYSHARLELKTHNEEHRNDKIYLKTMDALGQLARDEDNKAPVRLDFDYLQGLYGQLASECIIHPAYR